MNPLVWLSIVLIRVYQIFISPLFGNCCRFFPSCSHYALLSFKRFGFFRGMFLTARRLLKCHPYHEGGFDPVPTCKKKL
jgi:putative membrane protein insertion efficiency factor